MIPVFSKETPFTNLFGICFLIIAMLAYLNVINMYDIYFNYELIYQNHQFWRLITSLFFYGPMSLDVILCIFCFLQYCNTTESSYFANRPADFLFFCLFGMISLWVFASFYPIVFLGQGVSAYFTYYSAKRAPDAIAIAFILPIPMPAPYINLLFLLIYIYRKQYQILILSIVGYLAAHTYYYLHDILNLKYGFNLLKAPQCFDKALNRFFTILNQIF